MTANMTTADITYHRWKISHFGKHGKHTTFFAENMQYTSRIYITDIYCVNIAIYEFAEMTQ